MANEYKNILQNYHRFCSHCGKRFSLSKHGYEKELTCPSCGYVHWLNSKPTATCFIFNERDELLLTKRAIQPLKGWWDVPGGFVRLYESPEKAVKREIREELGISLTRVTMVNQIFVGVYQTKPVEITFNVYFTAKISSKKQIKAKDDVAEALWFPLQRLPQKIAFENNKKALRYVLRARKHI